MKNANSIFERLAVKSGHYDKFFHVNQWLMNLHVEEEQLIWV